MFMLLFWLVISKVKVERGLALQDLLSGAYEYLETIELKPQARIYLLDHLATTEYVFHPTWFVTLHSMYIRHRLSTGGSEKIQLTALLAAFKNSIDISAQ